MKGVLFLKGRERERDGEWGRQRETEIWDARNEYMMNIFSVLDRDIRVGFTENVRVEPRATKSEGIKNAEIQRKNIQRRDGTKVLRQKTCWYV